MVRSVLHILPHRGGGAETWIDMLEGGRYVHERAPLSESRIPYRAAPSIARAIPALARRAHSFDVVQAHGDVAALLALRPLHTRPSIWTPQGLHLLRRAQGARARVVRAGLRQVIAASNRVICSQSEADDLAPLAGAQRGKLVVIDNGVRLPPWPAPDERAHARAQLGLEDQDVVALYLGQLEERKDPLTPVRGSEAVPGLTPLVGGQGRPPARRERPATAAAR